MISNYGPIQSSSFSAGGGYTNSEINNMVSDATTNGYTMPGSTELGNLDTMVSGIKALGTGGDHWAAIDHLAIYKTNGDANWACYNIKDITKFNVTRFNSPTLTPATGFTGNGTSAYLRIDNLWHGATGANIAEDDSFWGVGYWGLTDCLTNNSEEALMTLNWGGSNNRNLIYIRGSSGTAQTYQSELSSALNNGTATDWQGDQASFDNGEHSIILVRQAAGSFDLVSDNTNTKTETASSGAVTTSAFNLLRADTSDKYCNYAGLTFSIVGGGLSKSQVAAITTEIETFLATVV